MRSRPQIALLALPRALLALPMVLATTVHPLRAAPRQAGPGADDRATRIDEIMAQYEGLDGPGAVVAVVERGRVVFAKAYGASNLEHRVPLTRESVLDIGSVAKQLTAFAVVLLAQRGDLSLEDDIRTYLPEIPDFGTPITIRHLIHHMSGLREIYNAKALEGWRAGDGIAQGDALHLTARMRELNFEPGSEYLYCNTGYMLLADIVAEVSGKTFPEFLERNVFEPLGMNHTTIMSTSGQSIPNAAESYRRDGEDGYVRVFDNSSLFGAGGIYTTVDDLAAWMTNYRTGEVGGSAAIDQMLSRGVLSSGDTLDYAFGINLGETRGLATISHGGSSAGFRASFTYFPELDAGVITMSNFAGVDGRIAREIAEAFFGDDMEPAADEADDSGEPEVSDAGTEANDAEAEWQPSEHDLGDLSGRYYSPELETVYTLAVRGGRLVASHRRHSDFALTPIGEDAFEGASFFGTVVFERDPDGRPTGMRVSNGRVRDLLFERRDD